MEISREITLNVLFLCLSLVSIGKLHVKADVRSRIFCDGDIINLQCPDTFFLTVYGVFYRVLEPGSLMCKHVNVSKSPCHPTQISRVVRTSCQGKSQCLLPSKPIGDKTLECLRSLYLTVWYDCGSQKAAVGGSGDDKRKKSIHKNQNWQISTPKSQPPLGTQILPTKEGGVAKNKGGNELSYFSFFFWTLFSASMAVDYIQARPRHVILCVILSASAGIVILIVAVLLMACYQKIREEKEEESESDIDISAPIVTTGKEIENQVEREQVPLIDNERQALVCSNSVHEVTVAEVECEDNMEQLSPLHSHEEEDGSQDKVLSEKEAKELGHLVDIMRFYNSKLSSSQHSLPQLKDIAELQRNRNDEDRTCNMKAQKSYTLPRRASKDELDELFQQLSNMSPSRNQGETFDNCPGSDDVGLYENLDSPVFATSTPIRGANVGHANGGTLGRRQHCSDERNLKPCDNLPANYAFLEKSASTLLKELNGNNDNDFLSSRSSSQTSEVPNSNGESKFSTFHSGRGGNQVMDHPGRGRQCGTLDRSRRYDRPDALWPRDNYQDSKMQIISDPPEVTVLNSGLVRHRSDSSDFNPKANNYCTVGHNRGTNKHEIPLSTFGAKSNTLTYDTPRPRDYGYYQHPPANSHRIRILQQDL